MNGKYSVMVRYDANDNIYIAKIPELPGCTAHGKNRAQAVSELEIAEKLWLECALSEGKEIPKPDFDAELKEA